MPIAPIELSSVRPAVARKLYTFIGLDQYQSGIWGASLQKSEVLYGVRSDPGSITVSVACSLALQSVSAGLVPAPMSRFRDYLVSRRSQRGAFGMRESRLARGVPVEEIREHTRHTATAAMLFLHMNGPEHPYVIQAARYLLDPAHRTRGGYWAEEAGGEDERADPITAAYVVSLFETLRFRIDATILPRRYPISTGRLEQAIDTGLSYLFFAAPRTEKGGWLYRYKNDEEYKRVLTNEYAYTTDVLKTVAPAVQRTGTDLSQYVEVIENLRKVSRSCGGGIPSGRNSNVPDLTATIDLADAASQCTLFAAEAEEIRRAAYALVELAEVFEAAAANGWAAILRADCAGLRGFEVSRRDQAAWAREVAMINAGDRPKSAFWTMVFEEHEDFIVTLLQTKAKIEAPSR